MRKNSRKRIRFSLKSTQLILFAAIIIAAIALNMVTLNHTQRYMRIFDESLLGYHSIQRLHGALDSNRGALSRYLRDQQTESLDEYQDTRETISTLYSEVRERNYTSTGTGHEIRGLYWGFRAYFEYAEQALADVSSDDADHFHSFLRAEKISDYLFIYIQRLMQLRLSEELDTHERLRSHASTLAFGSQAGLLSVGIMMLVFTIYFTRRLTQPISKLADGVYRVAHGDLNTEHVPLEEHRRSFVEIDTLCESFNYMQRNIRELVEDLRNKAAVERQLHEEELKNVQMQHALEAARLQGLQAQINPHFLFNTLNTISRIALFERADSTTELIQSLANLLRYHLRATDPIAPLELELRIVREYIHIQKFRFSERLRFDMDIQVDAERVQIPVFTIQPLVENAVKYGIEPLEEGGEVRVVVQETGDSISIRVEDTGAGMPAERIRTIQAGTEPVESENSAGIGLRNVIDRLRLLYHGEEEVSIESEEGTGTTINLKVPNKPDATIREQLRSGVTAHDRESGRSMAEASGNREGRDV